MATHGAFPSWLLDSKSRITKTKEWTGFIENLSDAVQQQLTESHIQTFTDLTDAERTLLIDKAAKSVHGGEPYMELYGQVSKVLDQHLNNQVAKELLEDFPIATKSDLILEEAQEGAMNLLRRWPDMKSKLHVNFNQDLPPKMRRFLWKLALDNSKVRQLYLELMKIDPKKAISPLDLEISKRCEQLIVSESTLEPLKGSIGAFYGMKAVLSYHHALKRTRASLPQQDLLLMVPFVAVVHSSLSRVEPASPKLVTLLVEEYLSFMHSRPGFLLQNSEETMRSVAQTVTGILKEKCPDLIKKISTVYGTPKDKLVETDFTNEALLVDAVQILVGPVVSSMFVAYVALETVLFIWDQYMLGMNSPGFHELYVPIVTAVFIMLLKEKLEKCDSMDSMKKMLKDEGAKLQPRQFQFKIKRQYYEELYDKLTQGGRSTLPVLDPTQIQFPFYHWHSERVPVRTNPSDRNQARQERHMERQGQLDAVRQQQAQDKQKYEDEKREDFDKYLQQAAEDRKRTEEDRMYLEKLLDQERRRRFDEEKESSKEIERLKEELENMKRKYGSQLSGNSAISRFLIPPPNTPSATAADVSSSRGGRPTPARGRPTPAPGTPAPGTPETSAQRTVTDLLTRITQGLDLIAHGEGSDASALDDETLRNLLDHKEDLKQAEIYVFGRVMEEHDYARMSESEQETARQRVAERVKKRVQDRHERNANSGRA